MVNFGVRRSKVKVKLILSFDLLTPKLTMLVKDGRSYRFRGLAETSFSTFLG